MNATVSGRVALGVLLGWLGGLRAHGPAPAPVFARGSITVGRTTVGFTGLGARHYHALYLSGPAVLGWYNPFAPYGLSTTRVAVYYYSPPPVVVAPVPLHPLARPPAVDLPLDPWAWPDLGAPAGPGAAASVFRPIQPGDRLRALQPGRPEVPRPPAPKAPAAQPEPPPLPAPRPPADPREEYARQIERGKQAFAAQEYGRARRRWEQAAAQFPDQPLSYFLLAQAHLALGKYREAVEALHRGLHLSPAWPAARFRPRELYGGSATDFPEHLQHLEETVGRHPDDSVLLFLVAYQLWFDGRQEEARRWFQRAVPVTPDKRFIELFLQTLPTV
jgi:hypothetical protein